MQPILILKTLIRIELWYESAFKGGTCSFVSFNQDVLCNYIVHEIGLTLLKMKLKMIPMELKLSKGLLCICF